MYLKKRSFELLLLGAVGTLVPWAATALFDYIGSANFNCALLEFLCYTSNSAISYPVVLKLARYANQVSIIRLTREFELEKQLSSHNLNDNTKNANFETNNNARANSILQLFGEDPLKGEASWNTFVGHVKFALFRSKSREARILNAKFSQTFWFKVFWFGLTAFPFLVAYFIRLGTNPEWAVCTGCEIASIDAILLLCISIFALTMSILAYPMRRRKKTGDGLKIARECFISWQSGGLFYNLAYILFLF